MSLEKQINDEIKAAIITERIAYCGKKSKISFDYSINKAGRVAPIEPPQYIPSGGQGLKKRKA